MIPLSYLVYNGEFMPIGVDIFSGAGGLSLGAEMAGIEIIFAVEQDGINTQSYGVTNFIIFASVGGKMDAAAMGISSGWGGIRVTPEFYDSFVTGDQRAMFFTTEQQKEIDDIANFQHGYAFTKFKNVRSDGKATSNVGFVDTDFPVFRYAVVLFMLS